MATLNELVQTMDDEIDYIHDPVQFKIDENLRTIALHSSGIVLGVVGDKRVNRVNFQMPRYYNGFDMSEFTVRIEYRNASSAQNFYMVDDMTVEDNKILFTWLLDSDVTEQAGEVAFGVHMVKNIYSETDSGIQIIKVQSFKTTIATAIVLQGVELSVSAQDESDIVTRLYSTTIERLNTDTTLINMLISVRNALLNNDLSTAIGLLDQFILDRSSLS